MRDSINCVLAVFLSCIIVVGIATVSCLKFESRKDFMISRFSTLMVLKGDSSWFLSFHSIAPVVLSFVLSLVANT